MLFLSSFSSCVPGGDRIEELSGGYFFRDEGGTARDILGRHADSGEIPATVAGYGFNDSFIVASQVPKMPSDPLYGKVYDYSNGAAATYYWIIDIRGDSVWGPLSLGDYREARLVLGVPGDLMIKVSN
jgi:hypothetical protein